MMFERKFEIGKTYKTIGGKLVKFIGFGSLENTSYETMYDEDFVHRYTRRDYGRVTGSPQDFHLNTPPEIQE